MPAKNFLFNFLFFLILISCSTGQTETEYLVIKGATIFDGNGGEPITNSTILIRNDRIDCIGKAADCSIPLGTEVIDASGKFITPGLIDAHMHFSRPDFSTAALTLWISIIPTPLLK